MDKLRKLAKDSVNFIYITFRTTRAQFKDLDYYSIRHPAFHYFEYPSGEHTGTGDIMTFKMVGSLLSHRVSNTPRRKKMLSTASLVNE
jgi:hypothetical protein